MGPFFLTVMCVTVLGMAGTRALTAYRKKQRFLEALRSLESDYSLVIDEGSILQNSMAIGTIDGLIIQVEYISSNQSTLTRVTVRGDLPADMILQPEGTKTSVKKFFAGEDQEVGDKEFDDLVYVQGDVSFLGQEAREDVIRTLYDSTCLRDGEVVTTRQTFADDSDDLQEMIESAITMAQAVRIRGRSKADRLMELIALDGHSGIRRRAYRALSLEHAHDLFFKDVSTTLLEDDDPYLRLSAAQTMEQEGLSTLQNLIQSKEIQADLRSRALRSYAAQCQSQEVLRALVMEVLHTQDKDLVEVALDLVVQKDWEISDQILDGFVRENQLPEDVILAMKRDLKTVPPDSPLWDHIPAEESPPILIAVARASTVNPGPNAVPRLLILLKNFNPQIAAAAMSALGQIAGGHVVPDIRSRAEIHPNELHSVADSAVRQIQSRLSAGLAGGLSLGMSSSHGALSRSEPMTEES